jgi:hypothetical protein
MRQGIEPKKFCCSGNFFRRGGKDFLPPHQAQWTKSPRSGFFGATQQK